MTMPADLDRVITAALTAEADALPVADWSEDTVAARERRHSSRPHRVRHARRRSWAVIGAAAVVVAVAATATVLATRAPDKHTSVPPATATGYALPTNGWRPGDAGLMALFSGPFHAVLVDGHACAWLGDTKRPSIWPADWQVRFNPTQLIDPNGHVFANEGDVLSAGGGYTTAKDALAHCGAGAREVPSLNRLQQGEVTPETSSQTIAKLSQIARLAGVNNGDSKVTAEAVLSTYVAAERGVLDRDTSRNPVGTTPVWVVQVHGDFICNVCSRPQGAAVQTGHVITLILIAATLKNSDFSLGNRPHDLASLGTVIALSP
jgi:hypothetical protein